MEVNLIEPKPNDFFKIINLPIKAYILGIIYGAGTLLPTSLFIKENNNNKGIFYTIKDNINEKNIRIENPKHENDKKKLYVLSKSIATDLAKIMYENPNIKSIKRFPHFDNEEYNIYFIRGYYESCGFFNFKRNGSPFCAFTGSYIFLKQICNKLNLNENDYIRKNLKNKTRNMEMDNLAFFIDSNCLEFLHKIYKSIEINNEINEYSENITPPEIIDEATTIFYLKNKFNFYTKCCNWYPKFHMKQFYYILEDPLAVAPFKKNVSDSGYDISIISKLPSGDNKLINFYETGLKIKPQFGYYFDLILRSSVSKLGYSIPIGLGVIDRSYSGTLKIPLYKYNLDMPDIDLSKPFRIAQIVPRPIEHFTPIQVNSFENTSRGEDGFGSTGYL